MTTSNRSVHASSLRLQLSTAPGRSRLDGAWWPRSRDLEPELADLVDHFPPEAGHVARAIFSRPDWSTSPHRVTIGRGVLRIGSFPKDDTHVMVLRLSNGRQLALLVVPPDTPEDVARELMATASTPTNTRSGSELLAAVTDPRPEPAPATAGA